MFVQFQIWNSGRVLVVIKKYNTNIGRYNSDDGSSYVNCFRSVWPRFMSQRQQQSNLNHDLMPKINYSLSSNYPRICYVQFKYFTQLCVPTDLMISLLHSKSILINILYTQYNRKMQGCTLQGSWCTCPTVLLAFILTFHVQLMD